MGEKREKVEIDYSVILIIIGTLLIVSLICLSAFIDSFRESLRYSSTLLLGLLGIIIYAYNINAQKKMHQRELAFRKEKFDEDREEERKMHERYLHTFKYQETSLEGYSEKLASNIILKLKKDTSWASEALADAKLGFHSQSLFRERLKHFNKEKEFIVENFVPLLLERCKILITKENKKVFLIIDSGTTLYPFFKKLGNATVRLHENKEAWIKHLTIVTNNLAGVESLIESGRVNPNNRFSPLAIECHLLPGIPLPIYSALTGPKTEEALQKLREESSDNNEEKQPMLPIFIGLVTGNWIRIRRSWPYCPVPLARGEGHKKFKELLIKNSDEVYVIAPLGKIFVENGPKEVNDLLQYSEDKKDPEGKPYVETDISDEEAKAVKLISTSRSVGRELYSHSKKVDTMLGLGNTGINNFINSLDVATIPHILFKFDNLPDNKFEQIEVEFPHAQTRNPNFLKHFDVEI